MTGHDLTTLSGTDLAAIILDTGSVISAMAIIEATRRLRDDERMWQRSIERERDWLRSKVVDLELRLQDAEKEDAARGSLLTTAERRHTDDVGPRGPIKPPFVWTGNDKLKLRLGATIVVHYAGGAHRRTICRIEGCVLQHGFLVVDSGTHSEAVPPRYCDPGSIK